MASIPKCPRISTKFVLDFPQGYIEVDVLMYICLEIAVEGNIREWVLKLNKLLYGLKKASENWFGLLKTVI